MRALIILVFWLLLLGWSLFWAFRKSAAVLRISVWVISGLLCLFCLEVLSGLARTVHVWGDVGHEIHRWGGHWLVLWGSLSLCVALAATIERGIRLRGWFAIVHGLAGIAAVSLCWEAAFTGYLGPSNADPPLDAETLLRFRVLHTVLLPALLAILSVWLWLILRKYQRTFSTSVCEPK